LIEYPIRNYASNDLSQLVKFMNANHEFDQFNEGLVQEKLEGDPHWDPDKCLLCCNEDKIIGFMQAVTREIHETNFGFIKLMAVEKTHRRKGIASHLYKFLESKLQKEKVEVIRIYDVPLNYFMPGIDPRYTEGVCFAQKLGFKQFDEAINMTVNLDYEDWETKQQEFQLNSRGIIIDRPSKNDVDDVLKFVKTHWELWQHEVKMAFDDDEPTIHVAWQNGEIKAFSAYEANNRGMGWFGPMGTHPDLRGMGIGSILLKRCLRDMKGMGYRKAIIPWVGPIAFYAHHAGARIERLFWRYEKKLE
jgi:mycothiol synthase